MKNKGNIPIGHKFKEHNTSGVLIIENPMKDYWHEYWLDQNKVFVMIENEEDKTLKPFIEMGFKLILTRSNSVIGMCYKPTDYIINKLKELGFVDTTKGVKKWNYMKIDIQMK